MRNVQFILILFCCFVASSVFAQREGYVWYFGEYAGLDFNDNQIPRPLTNNNVMDQLEGCATICDPSGQLLFFTDGQTVWNRIFVTMPHGENLYGGRSSTQSAIIVPKPGDPYKYYLFTIDTENGDRGLIYSVVDMSLDNGLGDILWDQKNIPLKKDVTEKLSAVSHNNNTDYWILTHDTLNHFISYLLTENGLSTSFSSEGFISHNDHKVGYLKFSPDSKRVACAVNGLDEVEVYEFDAQNGKIVPGTAIMLQGLAGAYGVEFSSDGTQLYVSYEDALTGRIAQFDLEAGDGSQIPVANSIKPYVGFDYQYLFGALQLAPDGTIMVAKFKHDYIGSKFLDVIRNPNSYDDCDFRHNYCDLNGRESKAGLPNFVQSFFMEKRFLYSEFCLGIPTVFDIPNHINIDHVEWSFDDPGSGQNYSTSFNPIHTFSSIGNFNVKLTVFQDGEQKDYIQTVKIYPRPEVHLGNDTSICYPIILDAGPDAMNYIWSTGETTQTIEVAESDQDQVFWVRIEDFICWDADTIVVKSCDPCDVFIPNAFSPNNDGHNDVIKILGGNYSTCELRIYNSTGLEIFYSTNPAEYWDGTYNGQKLDIGVYVYTLVAKCIEGSVIKKKGNITLLR